MNLLIITFLCFLTTAVPHAREGTGQRIEKNTLTHPNFRPENEGTELCQRGEFLGKFFSITCLENLLAT